MCDYAACSRRARHADDGWWFCEQHYREHRSLFHGEPWPGRAATFPLSAFLLPCGTPAAARRHQRRGERCERCLDAATRYQNGYTSLTGHKRWAS